MSGSYAYESLFGPPSELLDIAKFIHDAGVYQNQLGTISGTNNHAQSMTMTKQYAIGEECDVSDIKARLTEVWDNPTLSAYLLKDHDIKVTFLHGSMDKSSNKKRKRLQFEDPSTQHPEVIALEHKMRDIQLKSWGLPPEAAAFIRTPKNTDQNALRTPKTRSTNSVLHTNEALITFTVYHRLSWNNNYLNRSSQHTILASQTLTDLYQVIICPSNEIPEEDIVDDELVGYRDSLGNNDGCVICIEGLAYGDGTSDADYACKLMEEISNIPEEKKPDITKAATSMANTTLSSLSFRLNQPYWLLHQGNCEHFIIFDQIRLRRPDEFLSGYPLTLQITPISLDLCRVCSKVPAIWSIVGDMRLGESPCLVCGPCWKAFGLPEDEEDLMVVPMPKYVRGWNT